MVRLTVNGAARQVEARPGETLLDLLRVGLGITSPKRGCQPQGQCGACVVLVDGEPHATCTIAAEAADGRTVVTVEGLPATERERFAHALSAIMESASDASASRRRFCYSEVGCRAAGA